MGDTREDLADNAAHDIKRLNAASISFLGSLKEDLQTANPDNPHIEACTKFMADIIALATRCAEVIERCIFKMEAIELAQAKPHVLILDDKGNIRNGVKRALGYNSGLTHQYASSLEEVKRLIENLKSPDPLVNRPLTHAILDHDLGDGTKGHEIVAALRTAFPEIVLVCHTGDEEVLENPANSAWGKLNVPVVKKRDSAGLAAALNRAA